MAANKKGSTHQYIAGRNAVTELLESRLSSVEKVLLSKTAGGNAIQTIKSVAMKGGVQVQWVPENKLESLLKGVNHQGVAALVAPVNYLDVDELLRSVAPDRDVLTESKPLLVILDRIEDPHNFGAILRSVVAVGAKGVIVPGKGMAPVNSHTVKTSAGTALRIPIARSRNLVETLENLKERGYWVAGADGEGESSVWEMDWDRPMALVIGNEHSGMTHEVKAACDFLVNIPIPGEVESLNASVAAGIMLFAARSRGRKEQA